MKDSSETVEIIVCWGSVLIGLVTCFIFGWLLMREVRRGKMGRFPATVLQGGAALILGMVPMTIAFGAKWLAKLGGLALFSRDGGNDGLLIGVGFMGIVVALGAAVLFAAVMIFQALTGTGTSEC